MDYTVVCFTTEPKVAKTQYQYDIRYDISLLKPLSECRAHTIVKLQVKNN